MMQNRHAYYKCTNIDQYVMRAFAAFGIISDGFSDYDLSACSLCTDEDFTKKYDSNSIVKWDHSGIQCKKEKLSIKFHTTL